MHCIHLINKKNILSLAVLLAALPAMAQQATATQASSSGYNQLEILLVIMMVVFLFVIWGLSRALAVLGRQVIEKNKGAGKLLPVLLVTLLAFAAKVSSAQDTATTGAVKVLPNYGGLSATTFYILVSVIVIELFVILFLVFSIRGFYKALLPQKAAAPARINKFNIWWATLGKKLTKAAPVEQEADVMLDHDYDGIRELDNPLPPWWKYGFYITIGIAIIYLLNFHVFGYGKNPTEEYTAEMANARIEKEMYEANNKDKIDENNVPEADAGGLAIAKEIFTTKCFACHGKLGEGGAGPNLTDNYWLHKGSLNDMYRSIKIGYPDKGMQSWATVYTPKEISYLASYVKSLHGTNPPNAKAPQGDLYADSSAGSIPGDSGNAGKTDSSLSKINSGSTTMYSDTIQAIK
ncbi:MAG: cbb3-type cytochrome c oxidase N-terminal domain-containing protein [Ginsengibacter sp.]